MKASRTVFAALALAGAIAFTGPALADGDTNYEITVTNLTRGQIFTPILAVSHQPGVFLFTPGEPASAELETLAESGNTVPLEDLLLGLPGVRDTDTAGGLLEPGQSVTLTVATDDRNRFVSLAGMLIPTNDGFVALNGVIAPKGRRSMVYYATAYDAGTEANDEDCANIPGPPSICAGVGDSPASPDDEGYVHVHAGIHGIMDLNAAEQDWRNPVARVVIRRISL